MAVGIRNAQKQVIIDIHAAKVNESTIRILRSTLYDLIKRNQVNIAINMSLVNSIESSLLGCLVSAQKKCKNRGGQINIYGLQYDILMIFYIIRIDEYISLYNTEEDALNNQNILIRRRFRVVK